MSGFRDLCRKMGRSVCCEVPGCNLPRLQSDLWELPNPLLTATITDAVESNFYSRCTPASRPLHLREKLRESEDLSPSSTKEEDEGRSDSEKAQGNERQKPWFHRKKEKKSKYDASLFLALHETFFFRIWIGGFMKLFAGKLASFRV